MPDTRSILLCADDFGLNPGVSQGIIQLVQLKRLSAVSCMANMPDFAIHAPDLLALPNSIQTGLHFNLTEGNLLSQADKSCYSLNKLLIKTHLRSIQPASIIKELNAQLDHYVHVMGQLPDFIDGHQHVHQFPVIRQAVLEIYEKRLRTQGTWIRSTYPAITLPQYRFKAWIIAITGGRALSKELVKRGIPHNHYFSGVYDFTQGLGYRDLFKQWLELIPENTLIMCHPGTNSPGNDSISSARLRELCYFLSDEFPDDFQKS